MSIDLSPASTISSLSDNFELFNKIFIQKISLIFEGVIKSNNTKPIIEKNKTIFSMDEIPSISLYNYLYRIKKYTKIEDSTLIIALIYIDRICKMNDFMINHYNIHKLLFTAIILAIKNNEDIYFTNSFYSIVGGISSNELKNLELEFTLLIQFKFYVKKSLFDEYNKYINNENINMKKNKCKEPNES